MALPERSVWASSLEGIKSVLVLKRAADKADTEQAVADHITENDTFSCYTDHSI